MLSARQSLFQFAMSHPGRGFDDRYHLAVLLNGIGSAGKFISSEINQGALRDFFGAAGSANFTGDEQQKLDLIADAAVIDALSATGLVATMASEENESLIVPKSAPHDAAYGVTFDPVDGSSNIDVAAPIGTIFGIYKRDDVSMAVSEFDLLKPGDEMLAAGYVLYGSSTIFVYTAGDGVHLFTLDPSLGEFMLVEDAMRAHGSSQVYSANEGNSSRWMTADQEWVAHVKSKGYTGRYIGALVADFHRNLIKGGIYAYPRDDKSASGKLRLLFECAPLAFVAEEAGGAASDGLRRIREIKPAVLHHRTPMYIGSSAEVALLEKFHSQSNGSK